MGSALHVHQNKITLESGIDPEINVDPPTPHLKKFHIRISIYFYINQGIEVNFQSFFSFFFQ